MRFIDAIVATDGKTSYWSRKRADVHIMGIEVPYVNKEKTFGELRVYFDDTWNTFEDGLIYTDNTFIRELQVVLSNLGYLGRDVNYSEQGMQGDDYVSFDVGKEFLASWFAKNKEGIHETSL